MVSEMGELIGISGLLFGDAAFVLVASTADLVDVVDDLVSGEPNPRIANRKLPSGKGKLTDDITLSGSWDTVAYVLEAEPDAEIEISVESETDAELSVLNVFGETIVVADDRTIGTETAAIIAGEDGPYVVRVAHFSHDEERFVLTSNLPVVSVPGDEDGSVLTIGEDRFGSLDYPGDIDVYQLELDENQEIQLTAQSVLADPILRIDFASSVVEEQIVFDDDSGLGPLRRDAQINFRAPHSGLYEVVVSDTFGSNVGGYVLIISDLPDGAEASPPPVPDFIASEYGPMKLFEDDDLAFSMQRPFDWTETIDKEGFSLFAQYANKGKTALQMITWILPDTPRLEPTMAELISQYSASGFSSVGETRFATTQSGRVVGIQDFSSTSLPEVIKIRMLVYAEQYGRTIVTQFLSTEAEFDDLLPMIEYLFDTFDVGQRPSSSYTNKRRTPYPPTHGCGLPAVRGCWRHR